MTLLDTKFLKKFVFTGTALIAFSGIGVYSADQVLVKDVRIAAAQIQHNNQLPHVNKPERNCQPGKQSAHINQEVNFLTSSNDPNVTWNAPGASSTTGKGGSFKTSFPNPGNYRVWASDNSTTCFVHVINPHNNPTPTPQPTAHPTDYPVYKPQMNNWPDHQTKNWPAPKHEWKPVSNPQPSYRPHNESNCPSGWSKHTSGVAVVCVPDGQNQTQEQTQGQAQSQNQNQNNNLNQNNKQNVHINGGNSSSSSNSSSSVSINNHN